MGEYVKKKKDPLSEEDGEEPAPRSESEDD